MLTGAQLAIAMPRGSGKSSLIETALLWSLIYGHRSFGVIVSATGPLASECIESVLFELTDNDSLAEDFPEVCYPFVKLEGINQRASGQICRGEPTRISISATEIRLPTVKGSKAAGAIIRAASITGAVRGAKAKTPAGGTIRPDIVLIDDPQTEESAWSPSQCATRERTINGAVLGLAGPGKSIAALAALTVVRQGDMADRLLQRDINPQWQGERTKMVYRWPDRADLWETYCDLWRSAKAAGSDAVPHGAFAFYAANRDAMDAGAEVAWPERHEPSELSAIQSAYNIRLARQDHAFFAEYQNEPLSERGGDDGLDPEIIAAKVSAYDRGIVPVGATRLTAFVDVQGLILYYAVLAWAEDFTGWIIDYGTEPEQPPGPIVARAPRRTLATIAPSGSGPNGMIWAGLTSLINRIRTRAYVAANGGTMSVERCLVDAGWGDKSELVYEFARSTNAPNFLTPSHGRGISAKQTPMSEWPLRDGERVGLNWRYSLGQQGKTVRHITFDTNWWKTVVAEKLRAAVGDRGTMALYRASPEHHRNFADHMHSETPHATEGRNRKLTEWVMKPNAENHWWDCVVGATVAASMQGVAMPGYSSIAVKDTRHLRDAWNKAKNRERR